MLRLAINGFGRIGKNFLRVIMNAKEAQKKMEVAIINVGKGEPEAAAYAFKYDSILGTYPGTVEYENKKIHIDNFTIGVISELDPELAPWKSYDIDWVIEASGKFTKREGAEKHLKAGAKNVLITAPAQGDDITIIPGVNDKLFDEKKHKIISLGSCTTNAISPMIKVLDDVYEIKKAFMTTTHAYTNSQALLDVDPKLKDKRRSRAAPINIVPTTTGATEVIDKIFPHLGGKIHGCALRVPVPIVSLIDLTVLFDKSISNTDINEAFSKAALFSLKNIVGFSNEPLVSSDYTGNSHSVVIDGLLTEARENMAKIFGWYDNEWAYCERLKDFLLMVQSS